MKFPEIWILNRLKRSGGQPVALGGCRCLAWTLFFGIGFGTAIYLCYKHAVFMYQNRAFGH